MARPVEKGGGLLFLYRKRNMRRRCNIFFKESLYATMDTFLTGEFYFFRHVGIRLAQAFTLVESWQVILFFR